VDSCVLLSEAWRHVCRPTRCLLLRRQRSSVLSYVNCGSYGYTRASDPYRRPSPGTTTAGLAVQRRSCVLPACLICTLLAAYRTASAYVMPVSERVLTEWIALEHGVNLLQQWVTVSVTWNYSQHLKFISCFIFIAVFSLCIVCTIHVWCAFCHTIIKGYTYLLTYLNFNLESKVTPKSLMVSTHWRDVPDKL